MRGADTPPPLFIPPRQIVLRLIGAGGAAKICRANATVKHVMEVSGFNSLLHLYETEVDALATLA
jgi:hypothetical protein